MGTLVIESGFIAQQFIGEKKVYLTVYDIDGGSDLKVSLPEGVDQKLVGARNFFRITFTRFRLLGGGNNQYAAADSVHVTAEKQGG